MPRSLVAAQRVLVEESSKARVTAAAVGDWILKQESLVKDNELLPAVMQHSALVANLGRLLERLGLERRARDVQFLDEYLASRNGGSSS